MITITYDVSIEPLSSPMAHQPNNRAMAPKRGTASVEAALVRDMQAWRLDLARSLALRNPDIGQRELNVSVQRLLDRIVFQRIGEARGMGGRLHDSSVLQELTPGLVLDREILSELIESLYDPKRPYDFCHLPAHILGHVYEQLLGRTITLRGGQVVVEDKPEVRKAGGVYYTPTWLVDFVLERTLGSVLQGKTPNQASKIRILDPSCGSGSFLIAAYQYLLDWHLAWYVKGGPEKHSQVLDRAAGDTWRLTSSERTRILLSSIHGVDIDEQAANVTKLSLTLQALSADLPDLSANIRCGNSLIGFDWGFEFPEIPADGFDVVIGNPPWGAELSAPELVYCKERYARVVERTIDTYVYFVDQALRLTAAKGSVGFVVPGTILNQVDTKPVRELLLERGLTCVVNLGQQIFSSKVQNTSAVFVTRSPSDDARLSVTDLSKVPLARRAGLLESAPQVSWKIWAASVAADPHRTFFVGDIRATALLDRMRARHPTLRTVLGEAGIQRGVSPDIVAAHVLTDEQQQSLQLEPRALRRSISGAQIKRYRPWLADQWIVYTTRGTPLDEFPRARAHLESFSGQNTCKEVSQTKHPWWSLHRPRDPSIFASPKFIGLTTTKTIELVYDEHDGLFATDAMYVFSLAPGISPKVCRAILQSKAFLFFYRVANQGDVRVIPQVKASKLEPLPYPQDAESRALRLGLAQHVDELEELHIRLAQRGREQAVKAVEQRIAAVDARIDRAVYELYGLTDDDVSLIDADVSDAMA